MKTQWDLPGFTLDISLLQSNPETGALKAADRRLREKFSSGQIGFYDLPKKLEGIEPETSAKTAASLKRDFEAALVLGIGGSYLGAASAVEAVGNTEFPLTWVSNIDPAAIHKATAQLKRRKHAAVIISKSGNTTETLAAFYHFSKQLDPKGFTVITDPTSGELRKLARDNGWTALEVPPNVGGRFSVLSAVGLLPCALGGVDIQALLSGARAMRSYLDECSPANNPAYLFASALHFADTDQGQGLHYLMPYWSSLFLFAQWYVQLWGESLGKITPAGKHVGPTPVAALGTTDQHSVLQLLKDGPRNKVVGFMDVLSQKAALPVGEACFTPGNSAYLCKHSFEKISHEACVATQQSLTNSGVPTYRLTLSKLDARALGALYFFFETATAFAGELYGINAFDQPGVEESKKLLHGALALV